MIRLGFLARMIVLRLAEAGVAPRFWGVWFRAARMSLAVLLTTANIATLTIAAPAAPLPDHSFAVQLPVPEEPRTGMPTRSVDRLYETRDGSIWALYNTFPSGERPAGPNGEILLKGNIQAHLFNLGNSETAGIWLYADPPSLESAYQASFPEPPGADESTLQRIRREKKAFYKRFWRYDPALNQSFVDAMPLPDGRALYGSISPVRREAEALLGARMARQIDEVRVPTSRPLEREAICGVCRERACAYLDVDRWHALGMWNYVVFVVNDEAHKYESGILCNGEQVFYNHSFRMHSRFWIKLYFSARHVLIWLNGDHKWGVDPRQAILSYRKEDLDKGIIFRAPVSRGYIVLMPLAIYKNILNKVSERLQFPETRRAAEYGRIFRNFGSGVFDNFALSDDLERALLDKIAADAVDVEMR